MEETLYAIESDKREHNTARLNTLANLVTKLFITYCLFDFLKYAAGICTQEQLNGLAEIIAAFKVNELLGWGTAAAAGSAWGLERYRSKQYKKERDNARDETNKLKNKLSQRN